MIPLQAVYLVGGNEQAVAALILDQQIVALAALHLALDQAAIERRCRDGYARRNRSRADPARRRSPRRPPRAAGVTTGRAAPNSSASVSTYRRRSAILKPGAQAPVHARTGPPRCRLCPLAGARAGSFRRRFRGRGAADRRPAARGSRWRASCPTSSASVGRRPRYDPSARC